MKALFEISKKYIFMVGCLFLICALFSQKDALATTVKIVEPDELDRFMNVGVSRLFIDGVIDEATPAQVEKILSSHNGEMQVYLNSPGGNLFSGIKTGKILRKYRATTFVGKYRYLGKSENKPRVYEIEPGGCESACAFAFLGGHYRFMYSSKSKLGVHRFWSVDGPKVDDIDNAQVITAAIVNYLNEMQIDSALMNYVVLAGKNEMKYLDNEIMRKLNVTNDGRALPEWSIDIGKNGVYLSGRQDIMTGGGQLLMFCDAARIIMLTRTEVGSKNAKMIIDERFIPKFLVKKIGSLWPDSLFEINPTVFLNNAGNIDTTFIYPYRIDQTLDRLDAIGVGYFTPDKSGRFIGFVLDIGSDENRTRIKKFLSNCNNAE